LFKLLLWIGVGIPALVILDRVLLFAEKRGWIHYRRGGLGRGASMYHLNELSQIFTGSGIPEIQEEVEEDDSGDLFKGHGDHP